LVACGPKAEGELAIEEKGAQLNGGKRMSEKWIAEKSRLR
jgi:hypothetical protein